MYIITTYIVAIVRLALRLICLVITDIDSFHDLAAIAVGKRPTAHKPYRLAPQHVSSEYQIIHG